MRANKGLLMAKMNRRRKYGYGSVRTLGLDGDRLAETLLQLLIVWIETQPKLEVCNGFVELITLEVQASTTEERQRVGAVCLQTLDELDDLVQHCTHR